MNMTDKTLGAYARREKHEIVCGYCRDWAWDSTDCDQGDPSGEFCCTRRPGHDLPHVACTSSRHMAAVWPEKSGQDVHSTAYWQDRAEKAEQERDAARSERDLIDHVARDHAATVARLRDALDLPEDANADTMTERATEPRPLSPEDITEEMVERASDRIRALIDGGISPRSTWVTRQALAAALTPEPQRPDWIDAPAVRAWHKNDRRTEHDGTPGVKRIWSPDYRTTETWSTPSLPSVHWTELVDVEPLSVTEDGAA